MELVPVEAVDDFPALRVRGERAEITWLVIMISVSGVGDKSGTKS